MITITDTTRSVLLNDDIALQAAHSGLLNFSAYAEKILPIIEERTFKKIKKGTVVVALTRISNELAVIANLRPELTLDDLSIKSTLCDITFNKTETTRAKLANLNKVIKIDENAFFTVTQGVSEITVIAPQTQLEPILNHFYEKPKAVYQNRVGITVRFSKQYLPIPNVLYTLQSALAVHRININEVISTYTEFSFIIDKNDLEIATKALQRFLR